MLWSTEFVSHANNFSVWSAINLVHQSVTYVKVDSCHSMDSALAVIISRMLSVALIVALLLMVDLELARPALKDTNLLVATASPATTLAHQDV